MAGGVGMKELGTKLEVQEIRIEISEHILKLNEVCKVFSRLNTVSEIRTGFTRRL